MDEKNNKRDIVFLYRMRRLYEPFELTYDRKWLWYAPVNASKEEQKQYEKWVERFKP